MCLVGVVVAIKCSCVSNIVRCMQTVWIHTYVCAQHRVSRPFILSHTLRSARIFSEMDSNRGSVWIVCAHRTEQQMLLHSPCFTNYVDNWIRAEWTVSSKCQLKRLVSLFIRNIHLCVWQTANGNGNGNGKHTSRESRRTHSERARERERVHVVSSYNVLCVRRACVWRYCRGKPFSPFTVPLMCLWMCNCEHTNQWNKSLRNGKYRRQMPANAQQSVDSIWWLRFGCRLYGPSIIIIRWF